MMAFADDVAAAKATATAAGMTLDMPDEPAEDGRARGTLTVGEQSWPVVIDDFAGWAGYINALVE